MKVALLCLVLAFVVGMSVAPYVIKTIHKLKAGQNILTYVGKHMSKQGTPTMGGIVFIVALIFMYLVLGGYKYVFATIILCSTLGYGLLGLLDDCLKVLHKQNEGLKAYQKAVGQVGIAVIMAIFVYLSPLVGGEFVLPFSFNAINIGWLIIPFVIFVFLAITNAVNLTDGLDGLAGGVAVSYLISFGIIVAIYAAFLQGNGQNSALIGELTSVYCVTFAFVGGIMAFLSYNCHPARIFMGDTGSLAIGGFIAAACAVTKLYLYMPLIGLMFVISAFSVCVQVIVYKCTKKRVFKMAPLHHHFELCGAKETKIVANYIIFTIVLGILCISFSL